MKAKKSRAQKKLPQAATAEKTESTTPAPAPKTKRKKALPTKAKRAARKPRAAKLQGDAELRRKRLAAGRKAAETRKANGGRRGPGRPPKDTTQARAESARKAEFLEAVLNIGIDRSVDILQTIRESAQTLSR